MLSEVCLGLGSNLGDRSGNINRGIELLRADARVAAVSSLYETEPQGFGGQPSYLNAACRLWTRLDPFRLMHRLAEIEASVGRTRAFANAPRTLDLDILLFGGTAIECPGLSIPHPRMAQREFVLVPLAEIAPALRHPVLKRSVASLLADLPSKGRVGRGLRPAVRWRDSHTGHALRSVETARPGLTSRGLDRDGDGREPCSLSEGLVGATDASRAAAG